MAHKTPTRGDYRKFGLFLAALFLAAGLFPLVRGQPVRLWALATGAVLGVLAVAAPVSLWPLHRASLKVGGVLGWINTRILLSLLFYLIFTPVGLVRRFLGGRGGSWPQRKKQSSYWHAREKGDLPKQMRHLF